MEYLKAAVSLLTFIKDANDTLTGTIKKSIEDPNKMFVKMPDVAMEQINMTTYNNEYVLATLKEKEHSDAFIITDLATMDVQGKPVTYLLYKAYHSTLEKGVVFYQLINKETAEPIGKLEFSNMEDNVFYTVAAPKEEESSCNAIETNKKIENGKSIAFLIGHMNEERLIYDIQRLIFDTVNNVVKHPKLKFHFIVQVSRYGASPSAELKKQVEAIAKYTRKKIYPKYPNATFEFEFEQVEL